MMKAVILAGGKGTRLRPMTQVMPKPMLDINGTPFLEYQIEWFKSFGITEIVVCCGYMADQIQDHFKDGSDFGVSIEYSIEKEPLGTAGALKKASPLLTENFIMINGDTMFKIDLEDFIDYNVFQNKVAGIASHVVKNNIRFDSIVLEDNQIVDYVTRADSKGIIVSGGIYMFKKDILKYIPDGYSSLEKDIIPALIKDKQACSKVYSDFFIDIGTPEDFERAQKELSDKTGTIIRSRAPVRLSFAGGGTDVSPFSEEEGGCVVNTTINKYVYGSLSFRKDNKIKMTSYDFDKELIFDSIEDITYNGELDLIKSVVKHFGISGIEISLLSQTTVKSGLGGSATAFVAVIGLFNHILGDKMTKYEIAELAYKLEREELNNYGGRQDQYASAFGGFNFMEFEGNNFVKVNSLPLSKKTKLELEKCLVLCNVGEREDSGDILIDQTNNYKKKNIKTVDALKKSKKLAFKVKKLFLNDNLEMFGKCLHEAWEEKKKFSSLITTDKIDRLYNIAREIGAVGGKISGAGGGGHMMFYCKDNSEFNLKKKLFKHNIEVIPFSFDEEGLITWETEKREENEKQ